MPRTSPSRNGAGPEPATWAAGFPRHAGRRRMARPGRESAGAAVLGCLRAMAGQPTVPALVRAVIADRPDLADGATVERVVVRLVGGGQLRCPGGRVEAVL